MLHYPQMPPEQICDLLEMLGAQGIRISGHNIYSTCPIHGGDSFKAFSYNVDDGIWTCFSRHCGEGQKRDILSLVMLSLDVEAAEAVEFLRSVFGIDASARQRIVAHRSLKKYLDEIVLGQLDIPQPIGLDINQYPFDTKYLPSRGFCLDTIKLYNIRYVDGWPPRILFPIYDQANILVGYSTRIASNSKMWSRYPKYVHSKKLTAKKVLWGLNHIPKHPNTIVIVEGFTDVMRFYQAGLPAVCVMGTHLSLDHMKLLARYATHLTLCFDGDIAGRSAMEKNYIYAKKYFKVDNIILPTGKDPADMEEKELRCLVGTEQS